MLGRGCPEHNETDEHHPSTDGPEDAYRKAFDGNTQGWAHELGELVDYLDAA